MSVSLTVVLATFGVIFPLNFYRLLKSDYLIVVGGGAIEDGARKHKISDSIDDSSK